MPEPPQRNVSIAEVEAATREIVACDSDPTRIAPIVGRLLQRSQDEADRWRAEYHREAERAHALDERLARLEAELSTARTRTLRPPSDHGLGPVRRVSPPPVPRVSPPPFRPPIPREEPQGAVHRVPFETSRPASGPPQSTGRSDDTVRTRTEDS